MNAGSTGAGRALRPLRPATLGDAALFALWRARAALTNRWWHYTYWRRMGRIPDLALPRLNSERMLWRKLFDHDPRFVVFCDKLAVKERIAARFPDLALPRTLWRGTDAEAIPETLIRPGVAIKANHGSWMNIICWDAAPPRDSVVEQAKRWLATNYRDAEGEWAYGEIRREVFVEELVGWPGAPPLDIQVRAGGGRVAFVQAVIGHKSEGEVRAAFDATGRRLWYRNRRDTPQLPADWEAPPVVWRAAKVAARLSEATDYARFDFLAKGDDLWAGEITVYPSAGNVEVAPEMLPTLLEVWDLRRSWFVREGAARGGWLARAYAAALTRAHGRG